MRNSVERFPVTVFVASVFLVLLIVYNEVRINDYTKDLTDFIRINMIVGLAIPLSLCIGLWQEKRSNLNILKKIGAYLSGIVALIFYYSFFLKKIMIVSEIRYAAVMIILVLVCFYISQVVKNFKYEFYVLKIFEAFFVTLIYALVLYLGIIAIIFTTNTLFDLGIDSKWYYYMFLSVSLIFAIPLLLSKLPLVDEELNRYQYSKSLKILLLYIVIPLITIYTVILYVYFIKILLIGEWPQGLVSHLVLWYCVVSVGVIFLITPILEENQIAKLFKIWFPKVIIPILIMMFVSIGIRVNQYGFTENRYFIVVLGIWVTAIMLYFSAVKPLRNIIIPISLSLIVVLAVFGPLSSFSVSKTSQNNRLNKVLENNNMLLEGQIIKNDSITNNDKKEIINIIQYFSSRHDIKDIKILPPEFEIRDMTAIFGFEYIPEYGYNERRYIYYQLNPNQQSIEIKGYDYYLPLNSWNKDIFYIDSLGIRYDSLNHTVVITTKDLQLMTVELLPKFEDIIKGQLPVGMEGKELRQVAPNEMTFEQENEHIKLKIMFISINGYIGDEVQTPVLENIEMIMLIHKK